MGYSLGTATHSIDHFGGKKSPLGLSFMNNSVCVMVWNSPPKDKSPIDVHMLGTSVSQVVEF
jgi:hypothetical protein